MALEIGKVHRLSLCIFLQSDIRLFKQESISARGITAFVAIALLLLNTPAVAGLEYSRTDANKIVGWESSRTAVEIEDVEEGRYLLGKRYRSLYGASWAAADYAHENDAIGVVIGYGPKGKADDPPEAFGEAIAEKIITLGEKARFFVGRDKSDEPGYTVSFVYAPGHSTEMSLSEVRHRIEGVIAEKREWRKRTNAFVEELLKGN